MKKKEIGKIENKKQKNKTPSSPQP